MCYRFTIKINGNRIQLSNDFNCTQTELFLVSVSTALCHVIRLKISFDRTKKKIGKIYSLTINKTSFIIIIEHAVRSRIASFDKLFKVNLQLTDLNFGYHGSSLVIYLIYFSLQSPVVDSCFQMTICGFVVMLILYVCRVAKRGFCDS